MANERETVPLSEGKVYHFNVIYNHARCPRSETPDTKLSRDFTQYVVTTLDSLGFVNSYYHERDARLGSNVFQELLRVVEGSDYTIAVLTPGFVRDCWKRYIQMTSFKTLLDAGQNHKFLPLSVGLSADELPQELNVQNVLYFQREWEGDEMSWNRLKNVFTEQLPVPVVQRIWDLPVVGRAFQESGAQGLNRPDEFDGDSIEHDDTFVPLHPDTRSDGNYLHHQYPRSSDPSNQVNQSGTNGPRRSAVDLTNQSTAADQNDPRPDGSNSWGASNPHTPTRHTTSALLTDENNVEQARSTACTNEENYSGVSMDLERRQATEHGRLTSQAGQPSERASDGEQARGTLGGHVGPRTNLSMTGLSMDADTESLVVNRLGGVGISEYRSELVSGNNQTHRKYIFERNDGQNLNQGDQNHGQEAQNLGRGVQNLSQESLNHGNSSQIQTTSGQQRGNQTELDTTMSHAEDEERQIVNEEDAPGEENTVVSDYHSTESSSSSYVYSGDLNPESLRLQSLCGNAGGENISTSGEQVGDAETKLSPSEDSGRGTRSISPETNSSSGVYSLVSTPEEATSETLNNNISGTGSMGLSPVASDVLVETSRDVQRVPDETSDSNSKSQTSTDDAISVTEDSAGGSERFEVNTCTLSKSEEGRAPPVESDNPETITRTSVVSAVETGQDDTPTSVKAAAENIKEEEEVIYYRSTNTNSEGSDNITRPLEAGTGVRGWILSVLGFVGHALLNPDPFYL